MVLEISNCDDCFKIKGKLIRSNLYLFQKAFENIFEYTDNLIINIEEVIAIDRDGVNAIAKLHNQSLVLHKKLSIIGLGNKDLYEEFRTIDAA